jgi:hypothetical protein
VFEEIAENLEALGQCEAATAYFRRAESEFGKDPQFARQDPARLARIMALGRRSSF